MIQTTIRALLTGSLIPSGNEYVYIIRSGEDVMYVGKTNDPNRRIEQHCTNIFRPFDKGDVLKWTVELREVKECREYVLEGRSIDLEEAEISTIQALNPVLNTTYNFHPSPMPARYKNLFKIEVGATDNLF